MTITNICPRKKSLLALYIDGEYAIDIDKKTFLESNYDVNININDDELKELIDLSNFNRAKEKALFLLSYKDYFSKDLIAKLKAESNEDIANRACDRMVELGYINDRELATRFAKNLLNNKMYSKNKVMYELKRKGLEEYLIEDVLSEIYVDEEETIIKVINKKCKNKLDDPKVYRRTVATLMRLGYNYDAIKNAIDIVLEE